MEEEHEEDLTTWERTRTRSENMGNRVRMYTWTARSKGRRMSPNIRTYCQILLLKFGIRVAFFKFGKKKNFAEFRISDDFGFI